MAYAEPVLRPPRAACARVPEAQWRDGGWRGSAGAVALSKPVTKYLSNGATNPIHARYYCGGENILKRALVHTPPPRPPPLLPANQGRFVGGRPPQHPKPRLTQPRISNPPSPCPIV